jgi:hypothetical protein
VFQELIAPSFVNLAAATSSQDAARELLVETVKETLRNGFNEAEVPSGPWGLNDIVDFSEDQIVRRWDGIGDDYVDELPLLAEYQTSEFQLDWTELDRVVIDAVKHVGRPEDETASVLRLDVVDFALYQALCKHPELLKTLNWRAFEELLADILRAFGFDVELQRGTKDGGVDIFAIQRSHPLGSQRYLASIQEMDKQRWGRAGKATCLLAQLLQGH